MLPHKMAKYHMTGEQVSKKEKGPRPSFSLQTVPVVAKMLPWQLTCSPFCDMNINSQESSLSPPRPPHYLFLPESPTPS